VAVLDADGGAELAAGQRRRVHAADLHESRPVDP
jgi:hypothetical protein